jgi:hypothetical protein
MPWDLTGNDLNIPSTGQWLGTRNGMPLIIQTGGFGGPKEVMRINAATVGRGVCIGTPWPADGAKLTVDDGDISWGNKSRLGHDQGGSIELGGDSSTPGTGTPYIDFHFQGLTQDFNTRIINDANGRLTLRAPILQAIGDVYITGRLGTNSLSADPDIPNWVGGIHTRDLQVDANAWVRNGVETGPRVLAENFAYVEDPSDPRDLEPGDVVCMGPDEDSVVISEQRDDGLVLGVVSSKPGFLLNSALVDVVGGAPMFPIALCGRVPCKVVDENGPIERGDLLATSSTSGRAMKASSVMSVDDPDDPGFKQVEFHRPGTILGKAVGSLQSGTGVIEVFVTAR